MKSFLFLALMIPVFLFGQSDQSTKLSADSDYYIDSIKVDLTKIYINGSNIESIDVSNLKDGKTYISLKENIEFKNLTALDIKNINPKLNTLFFVDNKKIEDPSEVKIDIQEISKIDVLNNAEIENQTAEFNLVNITTYSKIEEAQIDKKYIIRKIK